MTLEPGTRLGPYEVVSPLGAGGMGEVYRARDTRLGRDVAVKVLPAKLSQSPEFRARFEREAKAISSLNHPHICVLHDVGREGDVDYLVMELVEGETLAARIERGALATSEVFRIGGQIADALDRAHRAGLVHRDLKPGNVMLTRSGAKLMDFGLARAMGMGAGAGGVTATLAEAPAAGRPLTAEGTIIGTIQYMAPEQLEGQEVDARADLWALGCVLYEMATGKRAFEGKSHASVIGAIMTAQPAPVSQVAPMSPPAFDRLVAACLAKDPSDRVQSAHDVKLQLMWLAEGATSGTGVAAPPLPVSRRPQWIALALVALAAAGATALVMALLPRGRAPAPAPVRRFIVTSAELQVQSAAVLSPDGASIVFSVREENTRRLYRRALSSFESTPISGTEGGQAPFFSPDGTWIGFATETAIKKVPVGGGAAQTICDEPLVNSADWGTDGMIYFTLRSGGTSGNALLARVPATGGKTEVVAVLDSTTSEDEAWCPEILPGSGTVLAPVATASDWYTVAIGVGGSRHLVASKSFFARYSRSGHLLYCDMESQAVLAAPFDPVKAEITGPAIPLTEPVDFNFAYDLGASGGLLYVPVNSGLGDELVWMERDGKSSVACEMRGRWKQPRISPDGKRIVVRKQATNCELWTLDVDRGSLGRIAQATDNHNPVWSPDGRRIVYEQAGGHGVIVALAMDGSRATETIAQGVGSGSPQSWSAGGNLLVYTVTGRRTRSDIWVRAMDGSSPPAPFIATDFDETDPTISPDGKWIAYVSNETGSPEVFIRPYPDTGTASQVSTGGGGSPLWSRDGRELFFISGTRMMSVPIETKPTLRIGTPARLFDGGFNVSHPRDFDISPDGRRFVVVRHSGGDSGKQEMRIVLNWLEEMKRVGGAAN